VNILDIVDIREERVDRKGHPTITITIEGSQEPLQLMSNTDEDHYTWLDGLNALQDKMVSIKLGHRLQ